MPGKFFRWILVIFISTSVMISTAVAQTETKPVVRAVLFFSPTCGHCHQVIETLLLPMIEEKGEQLQILGINSSETSGAELYQAAITYYSIPSERRGVPTLIVGDTVLVGSGEIPAKFPDIVEKGLSGEGVDWPDMPGFQDVITAADEAAADEGQPEANTTQEDVAQQEDDPVDSQPEEAGPVEEDVMPIPTANSSQDILTEATEASVPAPDPVGMTLAWIMLVTMILSLGFAIWRTVETRSTLFDGANGFGALLQSWFVPLLAVIGLGVAGYLAYVEINQVEAVCGPIGECNLVQASPYAKIAGIPIAVLGLLNYVAVLVLWAGQKFTPGQWPKLSAMALLALTGFGVLFSIYLTVLEISVILAICMWCLSSAAITTALLWIILFSLTDDHRMAGGVPQ